MDNNGNKAITLDDLAAMVTNGFNEVTSKMAAKDDTAQINARMDNVDERLGKVDERLGKVEHKMEALNSNVANYLDFFEKRSAELKQRDALLAGWLKLIANKANIPIDVSQLEKI